MKACRFFVKNDQILKKYRQIVKQNFFSDFVLYYCIGIKEKNAKC